MTHLYIELNTGLTEEVNSSIISKLYELAISGDLDETSDLKGRLHSEYAYRIQAEYLNTTYPDLHISIDNYTIPFEDPNMLAYLNSIGVGSNGIITETQAAAATVVANSVNTTVTKFNELKYFTNITTSKSGYTGTGVGACRFYNWTALEEVDISNFTSIGHKTSSGYEDTFCKCSSLKKVTASDKLTQLGTNAFQWCTNLEYITGLSGNIELSQNVFLSCSKLKLSNFDAVYYTQEEADAYNTEHSLSLESEDFKTTSSVKIPGITFSLTSTGAFRNCNSLTSIQLSLSQTEIPNDTFYQCNALESVAGLGNVTTVNKQGFFQCPSLTTLDIDWSKITAIYNNAFSGCSNLTINNLAIPNLTLIESSAFYNTKVKTISDLGSITEVTGFTNCKSLTSVVLPNTCTTIGRSAFYNDSSLNSITLQNVKYVLYRGLGYTGLTSITFPEGFKALDTEGLNGSALITSITFPSSLTQILEDGNPVLSSVGLKNLDINSGTGLLTVTVDPSLDIQQLSIGGARNVSITVPSNVEYIYFGSNDSGSGVFTFTNNSKLYFIGRTAMYQKLVDFDFTVEHTELEWKELAWSPGTSNPDYNHCGVTFLNFPKNNFKYIPAYFLQNDILKNSIMDIIGDNLVAIGISAFNNNSSENVYVNYAITFPATLKYIGLFAFASVRPTAYIFKSTTPPIVTYYNNSDEIFFKNLLYSQSKVDSAFLNIPIYVPSSAVAAYLTAFPRLAAYIQANPNE